MNQHTDFPTDTPDQLPALVPTDRRAAASITAPQQNSTLATPQNLNLNYFVPALPNDDPVTASSFSKIPFVNLPLYIPGITMPVVGFDGGINLAALQVHVGQGLLCALLPYLDMAALDFIELFCVDTLVPVAVYSVQQDDVDSQNIIPLYIPHSRLPNGPTSPVFLRVTRFGGGSAETQHLKLKVDTVAPGGINPIASTLQNENLPTPEFPPDIRDFGVTQNDANNGVPVTIGFYPVDTAQPATTYRAVRDRIRLSVGGHIVEHRVTESEASNQNPIDIWLYAGFWAQVGSGSHVCECQVIDEVGNASNGWSPAFLLTVHLNDGSQPLLPEPYIDEVPEETLDYDELNGSDAGIMVFIRNQGFALGDIIRVTVNGRAVDGTPITTTYESAPLTSITVVQIRVPFPNTDIRALVGGRFQLSYMRIRAGVPNRGSQSIIVQVIGTPIQIGLPKPHVIEAVGGVLDPQLLFVNVEIFPYVGQDPFDLVTLILSGFFANGNPYYQELDDVAGTGSILFLISNGPNGDIARLDGGSLRFYYRVTSADGSETRLSLDEELLIGAPAASLPEPRVLQALPPAYWFDTDQSTDKANIRVLPNADIQLGDVVNLYCEGDAPGGTAPVQNFLVQQVWVGRELPFTLLRQYITPNQTMRIYYTRVRDNEPTRLSHAVNMRVGARLELLPPRVVEATVTGTHTATLNPLHVLPHPELVTIDVISTGLPPGADIKVFIIGKSGIGAPNIPARPARPEPGENYTRFTVSNEFVGAYLGEDCKVFYNLIQTGRTDKSQELTLTVQALAEQELDLVSVPQAPNGVINSTGDNDVKIDIGPFFAPGKALWIDLQGPPNLALRNGTPLTQAELNAGHTLNRIPASYLSSLPAGSSMEIDARGSLDGTGNKGSAVALKPVSYAIQKSGEVVADIPIGTGAHAIAFTPDGKKLYVSNSTSNTISVIDLDQLKVVATLSSTSTFSLAISADGTRLYAPYTGASPQSSIYVYNTANDGGITAISPGLGYLRACAINNINTKLLCSSISLGEILVINVPSYSLNRRVAVSGYINEIITSPDGSFAFIRRSTSTNLQKFDYASEALGAYVTGFPGALAGVAFSHTRQRAYATTANGLHSINYGLNTIVGQLAGFASATGVACHPTRDVAYVTDPSRNEVVIVDTRSDTPQRMGTLNTFNSPNAIGCSPDGKYVCVCNNGADVVSVFTA